MIRIISVKVLDPLTESTVPAGPLGARSQPGFHAARQVSHVFASALLQQAHGDRGPIAAGAVNDHPAAARHVPKPCVKVIQRHIFASFDPGLVPFLRRANIEYEHADAIIDASPARSAAL
jgi:hypothetical protein